MEPSALLSSQRVEATRAAFRRFLMPRLEADTERHRAAGRVFFQGRWMPEREVARIHYLLRRNADRDFLDLVIVDVLLAALCWGGFFYGSFVVMRLL